MKGLADLVSVENSLLGLQIAAFLLCHHTVGRKRTLISFSSYNNNPIMRALPSSPHWHLIPSSMPQLQKLSHWRLGFQHVNFGGGGYSQPIACTDTHARTHTHAHQKVLDVVKRYCRLSSLEADPEMGILAQVICCSTLRKEEWGEQVRVRGECGLNWMLA